MGWMDIYLALLNGFHHGFTMDDGQPVGTEVSPEYWACPE